MIKKTTCLSEEDFKNLHGNDLYVTFLRNKVKCEIKKDDSNTDVFDYIKEVPEFCSRQSQVNI